MQIHHLALILAALAGVLLVLLMKIFTTLRSRRRGTQGAKSRPARTVPSPVEAETVEPPRQRNRQIVPVSTSEAPLSSENSQQVEGEEAIAIANAAEGTPRGFYADVEARLAILFDSYEAGETTIDDYAIAVSAEARRAETHDADLAASEAEGTISGAALDEARQEAGMAREAIAWCLDWAESLLSREEPPTGTPNVETTPGLSAAA